MTFVGYEVAELFREDERFVLRRAQRNTDHRPVVIEYPRATHPAPAIVRQLEHACDVAVSLPASAVLRPVDFVRRADRAILVFEDNGGTPLRRLLGAPLEVGRFLGIAVHAARALAEVHEHHVVHKDIRPDNLIVDVETAGVRITGFDLSSRLPREWPPAEPASLLEESLRYMSPEQTGRVRRAIDDRTDLYSLGVTFYEMLTGRSPFQAADALEWVYCHVAVPPTPPHELAREIPGPVSAIVLRLLAKVPEDRYQTARGLEHDLEECLAQWTERGAISAFPLGSADCSEWFHVPEQLHGRERELRSLRAGFARVAATGRPELILVRGHPGIGKSALVHELREPVAAAHGVFLAGKFDEKKRDIPYSTVVEAFTQLVRRILTEDEGKIAAWRGRLLAALGGNAQLVVGLVPELELVIGAQPAVAPPSPAEERNRFDLVLRRFLGVFAEEERPLLLFLDDLQWADTGSLTLIQSLLTHPDTRYVLLVGAFRDDAVDPTHPLALTVDAVRAAGAAVGEIALGPLSAQDIDGLVADALRCSPARAEPLAALVAQRTGGNPFFALSLLTTLHERSLITFDRTTRSWSWDLARVEAEGSTDDVVAFLTEKVNRLAPDTRAALVRAACVGDEARAETLAALGREPVDDTHRHLWPALRDGLMVRAGDAYRFAHDRVRQAAYLLVPEGRRAAMHLAVARAMRAATPPEEREARVFDLLTQYRLGGALVADAAEREEVARLSLLGGRRARAAGAYESAIHHLTAGQRLLGADPFAAEPALAYDLCFELAACVYLHGDAGRAAALLTELEPRAATKLQRAEIRRLEVDLYTSTDRLDEAVARGALGLALFGITISPHPTRADVEREYERVWRLLGERRIEDLLELPSTTDPEICAAQGILAVLFAPAINTDPNLSLLIYASMVQSSVVHGNSDASAVAYAYFGMSLGPAFGRYEEGVRFGELGYALMERRPSSAYKAKIIAIFGDNTIFWTHHLEEDLPYLEMASRAAIESGDVTFACYCCNRVVADRLFLGHALDDVASEAERRLEFTRSARFDASTQAILAMRGLIDELRGCSAHAGARDGDLDAHPWAIVRCWRHIMTLVGCVLFGEPREAVAAAERARPLLWSTIAHCQQPEFWYYGALALAGHHDLAGEAERPAILAALREHEQQLAVWAQTGPENFGSKHALCVAELARIEDRPLDAMRAYDQAAASARENGYVQNEAMANEAAGRFHLARGFDLIAAAYLREARRGYAQWGAHAKVAELERRHAFLREPASAPPPTGVEARSEQIDRIAVLRAAQAIGGEIELSRLLEVLVRTVMQHACAERGLLLLAHGEELRVEAEASSSPEGVRVALAHRAVSPRTVPASVVNYVRRTRRAAVLDEAQRPNLFSADPYFAGARPAALLCMPIVRQTELVGVLYLESGVPSGAWPSDRLAALEVLASQAAISLQNATLYAALRRSEEQLRAIVDNSAAVIYVKDLEGRYLLANKRLEEAVGAVIGRTDGDLFPREAADTLRANDRRVIEALAPMEYEETVPQGGSDHTYLAIKFPLRDAAGHAYASCGISTDITQRVEAEKERARLLQEAQEALRVRDEFLTVASHELRTPLTPLRMQVQTLRRRLRDPALAPEAKLAGMDRLADVSARSVERLERLVGELLDVSRILAGPFPLRLEEVELGSLAREVVDDFRQVLLDARSAIDVSAEERVVGRWDRLRVEQAIVNLLSNAVKYGAGKPISVSVRRTGASAALCVTDRGLGIPAEAQARIFDRFERAVSPRSFGGLGLGLYIARQIVEAHGGSIRVASEPARGATFTIELPLGGPGS